MKNTRFVVGLSAIVLGALMGLGFLAPAFAAESAGVDAAAKARIQEAYGKLPMYFIQNDGQLDERVSFYERGAGHTTFFTKDGVYLSLVRNRDSASVNQPQSSPPEVIKLLPLGANKDLKLVAEGLQEGKVNYFIGNAPQQWRKNIPTYRAVRYKGVYQGIDIKFYGNNRQLEYDIIVRPGADPAQVILAYEGIEGLKVAGNGELEIILKQGSLIQHKPYIYQQIEGRKVEVAGAFKIHGETAYGFELAAYDKSYPLIIDPVLSYSTYLGGTNTDIGTGIAVDSTGAAYITGDTRSTDFPTQSPIQGSNAGGTYDIFVTKIAADGASLAYSTYLGGTASEVGYGIAVDSTGAAYIIGYTDSTDFPTQSPIQGSNAGGAYDAFVTKIAADGASLSYSTYLGGTDSDLGNGIAVDSVGAAYITGKTVSSDFPTQSPIQAGNAGGAYDAFVTKIAADGTSLSYSTYLGGTASEVGAGIAVDSAGAAYIAGFTASTDFPTQSPIQAGNAGGTYDAFVTKIAADGTSLSYSTYLGGTGSDVGYDIALDSAGAAYIIGYTDSTDFPTQSPIQASNAGGTNDAFVTKIAADGASLAYSTYLGGTADDQGRGIALDSAGAAYIIGDTASADFPTQSPIQAGNAGGTYDAFVTKIAADGASLSYSTYLGGTASDLGRGIALDSAGAVYIAGYTTSTDFPTQSPIQGSNAGSNDAFVAKLACIDADNDGYYSTGGCDTAVDCDDSTYSVNPGAVETCNNTDDDCDGSTDEDLSQGTACGVGVCNGNTGVETCTAGVWGNDTCDPLAGAGTETCNNTDDDCDGSTDEDDQGDPLSQGTACGVGVCASTGTETCSAGAWTGDTCSAGTPGTETCDGLDNNCDGVTDEGSPDNDGDVVADCVDNCPDDGNADQSDLDADGLGDVCDIEDTMETASGLDVVLEFSDINPALEVSITFEEITGSGHTNVTVADTTETGTGLPAGFELRGSYFDLKASAGFSGLVEVCFSYDDSGMHATQERFIVLFHWENDAWVDVTSYLDIENNTICGEVTSFSEFAVGKSNWGGSDGSDGNDGGGGCSVASANHNMSTGSVMANALIMFLLLPLIIFGIRRKNGKRSSKKGVVRNRSSM